MTWSPPIFPPCPPRTSQGHGRTTQQQMKQQRNSRTSHAPLRVVVPGMDRPADQERAQGVAAAERDLHPALLGSLADEGGHILPAAQQAGPAGQAHAEGADEGGLAGACTEGRGGVGVGGGVGGMGVVWCGKRLGGGREGGEQQRRLGCTEASGTRSLSTHQQQPSRQPSTGVRRWPAQAAAVEDGAITDGHPFTPTAVGWRMPSGCQAVMPD